jgi:hypothetical protein
VIEIVIGIENGVIDLLETRLDVLVHGVILNHRFRMIGLIVGKRRDIFINREVDLIRMTRRMIRKVVGLLQMGNVDFIQLIKSIYLTLLDYMGLMDVFPQFSGLQSNPSLSS